MKKDKNWNLLLAAIWLGNGFIGIQVFIEGTGFKIWDLVAAYGSSVCYVIAVAYLFKWFIASRRE